LDNVRSNPQGASGLSRQQAANNPPDMTVMFDAVGRLAENVTHGGANADERREKAREHKKRIEKHIWLTVPTKALYVRDPASLISELERAAIGDKYDDMDTKKITNAAKDAAKKAAKAPSKDGATSTKGDKPGAPGSKPKEENKESKDKDAQKAKKALAGKLAKDDEKKHPEKHLKIKLESANPNNPTEMGPESQLYKDELPYATKQLRQFVEVTIKEYNNNNSSQNIDLVQKKNNWFRMVKQTEEILPEEGRDFMEISKLRFQQFEQEEERAKARLIS